MNAIIRVFKELSIEDIEKHMIVIGELSSECHNCREMGIGRDLRACPKCGAYFKYMGFRRKLQPSFLKKMAQEHPSTVLIDFDDFKKVLGQRDAHNIFKE